MHWMHAVVGRTAQRNDDEVEAAALELGDFLGDEGLREPRIALQDEGDAQTQWMREIARAGTCSSVCSSQGATRRETFVSPSSRPGTITSDGRCWRGSARNAAAMTAGS